MLTSKYIYHDSKDTHNKHSKGDFEAQKLHRLSVPGQSQEDK